MQITDCIYRTTCWSVLFWPNICMLCEHLMCREQELWLFHFGLPGGYGYTDNASEGYGGTVPPILEHMGYTAVEQCV